MSDPHPPEDTQAPFRITVELARKLCPIKKGKHGDRLANFLGKVYFTDSDCWFWYGCMDSSGYGRVGDPLHFAHRVSWELFRGSIPQGLKVLHTCDVRNCVNPEHLWLGTQKDNVLDMFAKGRQNVGNAKGEINGGAVLTELKVRELRKCRAETGLSYRRLGIRFGVSTMTAYRACVGQSWRHL